jgi:hypothetical protein
MTWSLLMAGCYNTIHLSDNVGKGFLEQGRATFQGRTKRKFTYKVYANRANTPLLLNQTWGLFRLVRLGKN